ncbi:MAG: hypothetical protein Q8M09_04620 [Pseudomonadota bacterium]|nr:hypothetical protein [Pseudomonadota bacterium]MDP2354095.1 hypothetical protein [Pseudomonadota bacterium]
MITNAEYAKLASAVYEDKGAPQGWERLNIPTPPNDVGYDGAAFFQKDGYGRIVEVVMPTKHTNAQRSFCWSMLKTPAPSPPIRQKRIAAWRPSATIHILPLHDCAVSSPYSQARFVWSASPRSNRVSKSILMDGLNIIILFMVRLARHKWNQSVDAQPELAEGPLQGLLEWPRKKAWTI